MSKNDVTGDSIKTGKGSQEKFAEGWDKIFGKKQQELVEEPSVVGRGHFGKHQISWDSLSKSQRALQGLLGEPCTDCNSKGGVWDCGWWYECPSCTIRPSLNSTLSFCIDPDD